MPFSRRRLRRAWFLEFDFCSACCAMAWAAVVYWAQQDMGGRDTFRALAVMSDPCWAALAGGFGAVQAGCVMWNTTWGRWLAVLAGTLFWGVLTMAVLTAVYYQGVNLPPGAGLYAVLALSSAACVIRLPREFPPRAG